MFLRGSVISFTKWSVLAAGCIVMSGCLAGGFEPSGASATHVPPSQAPTADAIASPTMGGDTPPAGAAAEFTTDFTRHNVDYSEILSGGPPKDGIPAIDRPVFESVTSADTWLKSQEPVISFEIGGDARAYPLQILIWHEIVNDTIAGTPILVSFCPLCNTAIAFERTVNNDVLNFGTTGRLRYSNLIMYDRQTESWWQQASGHAIAGQFSGTQLTFLPAPIVSWQEFKTRFPQGRVLSRETGYERPYGNNPYQGYDDIRRSPFLYRGPKTPDQLPAMARILAVDLNGESVAYPFETLESVRVINDTVGNHPMAVFWAPGTASAVDAPQVASGRDVGSANAFSRVLGDRTLTFLWDGDKLTDRETGSQWTLLGQAIDGPLAGSQLMPVVAVNHFWFSWVAFKPGTRIHQP